MALARVALVHDYAAEYREIIDWYRHELDRTRPPQGLRWEPIKIGPTWQWTLDGGWLLPEHTLGWQVLAWCGAWLRDKRKQPWQFTLEQARFILWYYALTPAGRWWASHGILQRLKGWGKDPIAATISAAACFGPVVFDGWDRDDEPLGVEDPSAWVQVIAVSQEQTKNTMKLFPSLYTPDAIKRYGIQIGRLNVWGLGDTVQTEAITSSVMAVEGGRPTQIIRNELQNWNASNQGHELAGAVEGNVAKSEGGVARILDIANAYRPDDGSVLQAVREAWEAAQSTGVDVGMMYDSLEAPADAPLTIEDAPAVVDSIAGDSYWLDTAPDGEIVKSIGKLSNPPSESRRKWYNQIVASADAWTVPAEWTKGARAGEQIADGEQIVMFFDASKSDDATVLIGARISDGFVFKIGIWNPQRKAADKPAVPVSREAVDRRVDEAFELWHPVAFWGDLSDARDSDTGERYWEPYVDRWATTYGRRLRMHAVKTGPRKHPIEWDMRGEGEHLKTFTEHCERVESEIREGAILHDGDLLIEQHVRNARRRPNKYGIGIGKQHRESARKIDAAVGVVGARMMWRMWQQQSNGKRAPGRGRVIVLD